MEAASASGVIDRFQIELIAFPDFPNSEPLLFETGTRFPRDIDRHIYTLHGKEGCCCTCIWQEWLATTDDVSFESFFNEPVHNFFLSQLHFEQFNKWPFGDRKHGAAGYVQAVSSLLGFRVEQHEAIRFINAIASDQTKGHWPCVCGSGKNIRECGASHIKEVRGRLGRENLLQLKRLIQANK